MKNRDRRAGGLSSGDEVGEVKSHWSTDMLWTAPALVVAGGMRVGDEGLGAGQT